MHFKRRKSVCIPDAGEKWWMQLLRRFKLFYLVQYPKSSTCRLLLYVTFELSKSNTQSTFSGIIKGANKMHI